MDDLTIAPADYGRVFEESAFGTLRQLYDEVVSIRMLSDAKGYEVILEATFVDLSYRFGCLPSPGTYISFDGALRGFDRGGREIWRSSHASSRRTLGGMVTSAEIDQMGTIISSTIAMLVTEWGHDLRSLPPEAVAADRSSVQTREEAEREVRAREQAEREARARQEQEARAKAKARAESEREAQGQAEREVKEAANGLGSASLAQRHAVVAQAAAAAEQAEARGDLPEAFRQYQQAWLATYRAEDEARWGRINEALGQLYPKLADKPPLPEEVRRYRTHADVHFEAKRFDEARQAYRKGLLIAPWWSAGRFNLALLLARDKHYGEAIEHMKWFLRLAPNTPNARTAQDKIYEWEASLR